MNVFLRACMVVIAVLCASRLSYAQTTENPTQPLQPTTERNIGVYGDSLADGVWSGRVVFCPEDNTIHWDLDMAAGLLGIGRTTLYRKLKEYQMAV